MLCELSSNATTCKRGYDVFTSIAQCCSTTFRASGGCANVTATPTTCYTPDSFWPDRTCKATGKCDILYPRTNVFATGEECCAKSFADGCKVFPTTCKVPSYVRKTCVDGQPVECKRGGRQDQAAVMGASAACCAACAVLHVVQSAGLGGARGPIRWLFEHGWGQRSS
jgi:hypothetical protein